MKKPVKYLPILMMAGVVLIIMTLFTIQHTQPTKVYITDSFIDESKVNLPGPNSQIIMEEESIDSEISDEGQIVFLKEDLREEVKEQPIQLASLVKNDLTEDEAFMNEMTKKESVSSTDGRDKYLIIAGTYTDDMVVLSKQAQYLNKGYSAEIIQFEDNTAKNICMGRFVDETQAETFANEIEMKHDISTFVYHQAPGSR